MAEITIAITVGPVSETGSIAPNNARLLEFLDDLINVSEQVSDGGGGERPMTQQEMAKSFIEDIISKIRARAHSLKRDRLARGADSL